MEVILVSFCFIREAKQVNSETYFLQISILSLVLICQNAISCSKENTEDSSNLGPRRNLIKTLENDDDDDDDNDNDDGL